MDDQELRLEEGQVLKLEAGDVVVMRCPANVHLSPELRKRLSDQMKQVMPHDVRVVILEHGMDLSVLRPAEMAVQHG